MRVPWLRQQYPWPATIFFRCKNSDVTFQIVVIDRHPAVADVARRIFPLVQRLGYALPSFGRQPEKCVGGDRKNERKRRQLCRVFVDEKSSSLIRAGKARGGRGWDRILFRLSQKVAAAG